jgi:hypothetical protein
MQASQHTRTWAVPHSTAPHSPHSGPGGSTGPAGFALFAITARPQVVWNWNAIAVVTSLPTRA